MPRKPLIRQNVFPYGITARSNNKDWFDIPMDLCWKIFEVVIAKTALRYGFKTHSFVLMSNHFHWLVTTPNNNLDAGMRYLMTETSRRIARNAGRINKIYGARYKWTLIDRPEYYANTLRYFYQNPLRAGITNWVEDYRWTTLAPKSRIETSSCDGLEEFIPTDSKEFLIWLNKTPQKHFAACMRAALKRPQFRFPAHPTKKTPITGLEFL